MKLNINSKYKLTFAAPFDVMNSDTVFEVITEADIHEMELNGLKPFELVYSANNLPKATMYSHIQDKVKIYTLKASTGYLYIPAIYVATASLTESGVVYTRRAMIFKICGLPVSEKLDTLMTNIQALITAELGIVPSAVEEVISAETNVSMVNHESFELDRAALRASKGNYVTQLKEVMEINAALVEENNLLKCAICNK